MNRTPSIIAAFACALAWASLGRAASVTLTNLVNSSWGDAAVWDTYPNLPAFDGTEDVFVDARGKSYSLDGDRKVRSLTFLGSGINNARAGNPSTSRVILTSGCYSQTVGYVWSSMNIQIDDGANAVTGVWNMISGSSLNLEGNRLYGLPASGIRVIGSGSVVGMVDNAANFACSWDVDGSTVRLKNHGGALGSGTFGVRNGGFLTTLIGSTAVTLTNRIELAGGDARISGASAFTLSGPVSGPGKLMLGDSNYTQPVRLTGANISAAGGVDYRRGCPLVVNGVWTGCGNIVIRPQYNYASLQGSGTIGMAAAKSITTIYNSSYCTFIAPGEGVPHTGNGAGMIGTLTLGTPGNGNSLTFGRNSRLLADLDGAESDRLVVNGQVNFSTAAETQLRLYGTPAANRSYTLMTYDAGDGNTFKAVYLNDTLVAAPESKDGVNGTHTLVYGSTSLELVGRAGNGTIFVVR